MKRRSCQLVVTYVNFEVSQAFLQSCGEQVAMDFPMELTLEQKFNLKIYQEQVKSLSHEESQEFLLEVLRQLMVKDNMLKHVMKQVS
ncbi:MAG: NblA/ycf18 family protein [Leptolyngbyaceae cyanobacterium]